MNLYDTLGIDPEATPGQIARAYRKMSMQHHPDLGGDAEKFRQLSLAYETLSDPERRKRYDETGETEQIESKALVIVVQIFHDVLLETLKGGRDPETVDLLKLVRNRIQSRRKPLYERAQQAEDRAEKLQKVADRVDVESGQENLLQSSICDVIRKVRDSALQIRRELQDLEDAEEVLNNYHYRHDEPDQATWPPQYGTAVFRFDGNATLW